MTKKTPVILDPEADEWCYLLSQVLIQLHSAPVPRDQATNYNEGDAEEETPDGSPSERPRP